MLIYSILLFLQLCYLTIQWRLDQQWTASQTSSPVSILAIYDNDIMVSGGSKNSKGNIQFRSLQSSDLLKSHQIPNQPISILIDPSSKHIIILTNNNNLYSFNPGLYTKNDQLTLTNTQSNTQNIQILSSGNNKFLLINQKQIKQYNIGQTGTLTENQIISSNTFNSSYLENRVILEVDISKDRDKLAMYIKNQNDNTRQLVIYSLMDEQIKESRSLETSKIQADVGLTWDMSNNERLFMYQVGNSTLMELKDGEITIRGVEDYEIKDMMSLSNGKLLFSTSGIKTGNQGLYILEQDRIATDSIFSQNTEDQSLTSFAISDNQQYIALGYQDNGIETYTDDFPIVAIIVAAVILGFIIIGTILCACVIKPDRNKEENQNNLPTSSSKQSFGETQF